MSVACICWVLWRPSHPPLTGWGEGNAKRVKFLCALHFKSFTPKSRMRQKCPNSQPVSAGVHRRHQPAQRLCPSSGCHDPVAGKGHSVSAQGTALPCSPLQYTCVVTFSARAGSVQAVSWAYPSPGFGSLSRGVGYNFICHLWHFPTPLLGVPPLCSVFWPELSVTLLVELDYLFIWGRGWETKCIEYREEWCN